MQYCPLNRLPLLNANKLAKRIWTQKSSLVLCLCAAASATSVWAQSGNFDEKILRELMPKGCTPNKELDAYTGSTWNRNLSISRHEITCREKVVPAIWPKTNIPEPKWPEPETVPHNLDLKQATGAGDDKLTQAYFKHLCDAYAGEWFYKNVPQTDKPVSVINLRPRENYDLDNSLMFDLYWPEARGIMYADRYVVGYKFVGKEPYRNPKNEDEVFEARKVEINKTYWLDTTPTRQYALKDWVVVEPNQGVLTFVERPLTDEERRKYGNYQLLRFSYDKLDHIKPVKTNSGRTVLVSPRKPIPANCVQTDSLGNMSECKKNNLPQHLNITPTNESQAQYGYTWREKFYSEDDLRLGITGDEFMVVDMKTGEVVALRRDFTRMYLLDKPYYPYKSSSRIDISGGGCANYASAKGGDFLGMAVGVVPYYRLPNLHEKLAAEAAKKAAKAMPLSSQETTNP